MINRKPACDPLLVINTDILSRTVSELGLSQLVVQILDTAFLSPPPSPRWEGVRTTYDRSSLAYWKARSGLSISVN